MSCVEEWFFFGNNVLPALAAADLAPEKCVFRTGLLAYGKPVWPIERGVRLRASTWLARRF